MYCWEQRFLKSEPPQPWESQNCCESFVLFHCFTSRYYCKNEATSEDHVVFNKYASLFICNIDSCFFFFLMFSCTFMLLCCWVRICQQLDEFVMCHEFVMCQWTDTLASIPCLLSPGADFLSPSKCNFLWLCHFWVILQLQQFENCQTWNDYLLKLILRLLFSKEWDRFLPDVWLLLNILHNFV